MYLKVVADTIDLKINENKTKYVIKKIGIKVDKSYLKMKRSPDEGHT